MLRPPPHHELKHASHASGDYTLTPIIARFRAFTGVQSFPLITTEVHRSYTRIHSSQLASSHHTLTSNNYALTCIYHIHSSHTQLNSSHTCINSIHSLFSSHTHVHSSHTFSSTSHDSSFTLTPIHHTLMPIHPYHSQPVIAYSRLSHIDAFSLHTYKLTLIYHSLLPIILQSQTQAAHKTTCSSHCMWPTCCRQLALPPKVSASAHL